MPAGQHSWQTLTFLAFLAFAMAAVCFLNLDPRRGITAETALVEANGKVAWVQEHRYGTRFGLVGFEARFDYPSKANRTEAVRRALNNAGDELVSIRYESDTHGPLYSNDRYHDVWEITIGGRTIRTYAETAAAWESDNRIVPWLGAAMTLCGIVMGFVARKARRPAQ